MEPGGPFRITTNRAFDEYVDRFLTHARQVGVYGRVKQSITEILGHLEFHPLTWGEPVRRLESFGLTVFHRIHDELSVVTPFTIPMGSSGGPVWIQFWTIH